MFLLLDMSLHCQCLQIERLLTYLHSNTHNSYLLTLILANLYFLETSKQDVQTCQILKTMHIPSSIYKITNSMLTNWEAAEIPTLKHA